MTRPTRAHVDLAALRSNYRLLRSLHGGRALAVLKANAYGHGATKCADALSDIADGFAVAFLDEALALRRAGITNPILILEGCFSIEELREADAHRCWVVVHQERQVRDIEQVQAGLTGLHVWLKIDSGMHRAGFALPHTFRAFERLRACSNLASVVLMSHMARADELNSKVTADQILAFDAATEGIPGDRSVANSACILAWPQSRRDWSRCGIALYGASPLSETAHKLQPVMTLESEVFDVRMLQQGEALGYGGAYVTHRTTKVGLVAVGYADGYPRSVAAGTPVAVGGRQVAVIGRVSMDMLTVDLSDVPTEGIGSKVELWGRQIPVNAVAEAAGTIAYEVLCRVRRVPICYKA